jgi:hypothetical protein
MLGDEAFVTIFVGKGRAIMINSWFNCARSAAAGACVLSMPVAAATITVTPATFNSAVAAAQPGDTLNLTGTYGNIRIQNRNFGSGIKINASYAQFTGTVTLTNVTNLYFGGGTFNIAGAPAYTKAAVVYGGSNIAFAKQSVTGSAGGEGIVFSGTTQASVSDGTFTGLDANIVFGSVTSGSASRNTIVAAGSDGIDIADSHNITASYNSCSGGNPSAGAHPDCVQLWSIAGNPLESGIIVSNNSATGPTQGFTAFPAGGGVSRVQIVYNTVNTSYSEGVACDACVYSNISYNTLSTLPGSQYLTNLNVIGGSYNTVVGNVITPYAGPYASSNAAPSFASGADDGLGTPPDLALLVGQPTPDPVAAAPNLARLAGPAMLRSQGGPTVAAVPEPSGWALLIAGFAAVGVARRLTRPAPAIG